MEEMIRLIVCQKGRIRAASFYISILIAYLEESKWYEAEETIALLENMELLKIESSAVVYLADLSKLRDTKRIASLSRYLCDV